LARARLFDSAALHISRRGSSRRRAARVSRRANARRRFACAPRSFSARCSCSSIYCAARMDAAHSRSPFCSRRRHSRGRRYSCARRYFCLQLGRAGAMFGGWCSGLCLTIAPCTLRKLCRRGATSWRSRRTVVSIFNIGTGRAATGTYCCRKEFGFRRAISR